MEIPFMELLNKKKSFISPANGEKEEDKFNKEYYINGRPVYKA